MSKKLRQQLKQLQLYKNSINPRETWVAENKATLLSQISNTTTEEAAGFSVSHITELLSIYLPKNIATMARPVLIFMIAIGATVGGWVAGVSASYDSLPGDALYGVKLATEKTQVALATVAGDKETETQLHLEFAGRRSHEVKRVLQTQDPNASKHTEEAITQLKKSIESAKQNVQEVGETDVARAVGLAKDVSQKTTEISNNLKDAVVNVSPEQTNLTREVVETKQIVTTAGLDAIRSVVEKTSQTPSKPGDGLQKKVADLVAEKITSLSEEAKSEVEVLKLISSPAISGNTTTAAMALSNTSTPIIPIILSTTSLPIVNSSSTIVVREAVRGITEKMDHSSVLANDAKILAEQKDLVGALNKAGEANQAAAQATQAVTDVKEAVKRILNEQVVRDQHTAASSTPLAPPVRPVPADIKPPSTTPVQGTSTSR